MTTRHMEDVREAYVALICVLLTLMAASFTAGFSLARVTAKPHYIAVPAVPRTIDKEV